MEVAEKGQPMNDPVLLYPLMIMIDFFFLLFHFILTIFHVLFPFT